MQFELRRKRRMVDRIFWFVSCTGKVRLHARSQAQSRLCMSVRIRTTCWQWMDGRLGAWWVFRGRCSLLNFYPRSYLYGCFWGRNTFKLQADMQGKLFRKFLDQQLRLAKILPIWVYHAQSFLNRVIAIGQSLHLPKSCCYWVLFPIHSMMPTIVL